MSQFLPYFGNASFTIIAFIVALLVIVAIHEFGHYIVGRWCGIGADVFSLGFGPVLWSRVDKRGTRWQIAAFPLGGYVKFKGDANAASVGGSDEVEGVASRETMLGAPVWARSLTVAAGPVANFILAVVVFTGLSLVAGKAVDPLTLLSVPQMPPIYELELKAGDQILAVDNMDARSIAAFGVAMKSVPLQPSVDYTIIRDGVEMVVKGPYPETTYAVGVNFDGAAAAAGVKQGDFVTAVNGEEVFAFSQLIEKISASEGQPVELTIWREGEVLTLEMTPKSTDLPLADGGFETRYLIGVTGGIFFDPLTQRTGLVEAVGNAFSSLWYILKISLSGMWHMITGAISSCNLSSPVGIAQASGAMASSGLLDYISFIGYLSAAIGLLNLLPIPILDGGHLVFHAYEAATGKKPSDKVLRVLIAAGLSIILTMMLIGLANDLFLC
ncbi:RIP metalloprotease RseP [Marivivens sp. LCG002]|uniref:RIP metalloprotease RseP n=1 Tax=Marivivens sp. LCG002 TaxID=3051171 RepID=UPI002553FB4B|nr:RIP metalloprotease RseP [Marivivens sp. LCG002]WIV52159.1 RIP metalloprotease RseP [Marivivens sp. LCG002]